MVMVTSGVLEDGSPYTHYFDGNLEKNVLNVVDRVKNHGYDYIAVVTGIRGEGKSNFAQGVARRCCPWFSKDYIAFTDKDFIRITNEAKEFSSVVLDESFASLNSRVTSSRSFLRILNHIQLLRQKHLFIFLCLPNYFDLSKNVAIYTSSHLFLVYSDKNERGFFCAFDRDSKKRLYIKGSKFLDYNCVRANFFGRFTKQGFISEDVYEGMKRKHLLSQNKFIDVVSRDDKFKFDVVSWLKDVESWDMDRIVEVCKVSKKTLYNILKRGSDSGLVSRG